MNIKTNIIVIIILIIVFMLGGHFLDIGDMVGDAEKDFTFIIEKEKLMNDYSYMYDAGNGFWTISSRKLYHLGYYSMYLCFFIVVLLYINLLFKSD